MAIKFFNEARIEGYLYEHNLEMKETGPNSKNPGTPFISGTIGIVTDDKQTNVIQVHFTYVTETTAKGKTNATFVVLKKIIDGEYGTVMSDGIENAAKIRVDTTVGLNEFYAERDGKEELVSVKRNEGGFVHIMNNEAFNEKESERCKFKTTMLITKVTRTEADPEKNIQEKVNVSGFIFDFRKALLPVTYTVLNEGGMNYFEGLEASAKNPVLTDVWGKEVSTTIVRTVTKESSWGDAEVQEFKNTYRDFIITGSMKEPYIFDDESTYTVDELMKATAERENYLATIKQRRDDYLASKKAPDTSTTVSTASNGGFNF